MHSDIRYEVSTAAACLVLAACARPDTPELRDRVAFFILEAYYEIERRLAEEPALHLLCPWCLLTLRTLPDVAVQRDHCPRCGGVLAPPVRAVSN